MRFERGRRLVAAESRSRISNSLDKRRAQRCARCALSHKVVFAASLGLNSGLSGLASLPISMSTVTVDRPVTYQSLYDIRFWKTPRWFHHIKRNVAFELETTVPGPQ